MLKKNCLENLRKKYQQEYGVAVFDIEAENVKSGIVISGKVLTENQKDEVLEEFGKNKVKIIKENIKVLSNADKRNEIGWVVVKSETIDLKSRFVSDKIMNEKILNRIRCSQAFKGEILRVLYKYKNQLLVQQSDLTLGWVNKSEVVVEKKNLYKEWRKGNFALKNKALELKNILKCHPEFISGSVLDFKREDTMQDNQEIFEIKTGQIVNQRKILKQVQNDNLDNFRDKIIKEAEKYLGAKYILGGKSKDGIDCSGLVQVAYKNSLGVILPKHSWDQKKMGVKVDLKDIKTGDLVFLIKKENGHKHVGIAKIVSTKNTKRLHSSEAETIEPAINLIHASLDKKKVVRQRLEKVFEKYDFAEARRVAE